MVRPLVGVTSQSSVVVRLVGAIGVVVVGVLNAVGCDHDAGRTIDGGAEQLHTHTLGNDLGTVQQSVGVIEDTGDDIGGVGIVGILDTHDLLLVSFLHEHGLTEESHLGFIDLEALTGTQSGLRIEVRGCQGHGQTLVTLDPLEIQTHLLLGGEQTSTQVGHMVGSGFSPVGSNRLCVENVSNTHDCDPPS